MAQPWPLYRALKGLERPLRIPPEPGCICEFGPAGAYLVDTITTQLRPQLQAMRGAMRTCFDRDRRSINYSGLSPNQLPVRGRFHELYVEPCGFGDTLCTNVSFLAVAKTTPRGQPVGFLTFSVGCSVESKSRALYVTVTLHCAWLAPRHRGRGNGRNLAEAVAHALASFLERLQLLAATGVKRPRALSVEISIEGDVYSKSGEQFVYTTEAAVAQWFEDVGVEGVELLGVTSVCVPIEAVSRSGKPALPC